MNTKFNGSRKGFTLAEVLITLGIIGVVAAMTIPTLIQNASSTRFASQFKKTVSTLSQAALMAQAQYDADYSLLDKTSDAAAAAAVGTPDQEGYQAAKVGCAAEALSSGHNTICGLLNNTLTGHSYLGTYTEVDNSFTGSGKYTIDTTGGALSGKLVAGWFIFALADGSYVGINQNLEDCNLAAGEILDDVLTAGTLDKCLGFIDANGGALPNREVTCAGNNETTSLTPSTPCTISMTGSNMGDVFPIVFHNGTVEPASNAAKTALTRGK